MIDESIKPAIDKINGLGYQISHNIDQEDESFLELNVYVNYQGNVIGEACFTDDGASAYCQQVNVDSEHRRKGIANAMYVYAEVILKKQLENYWADDTYQSSEAIALWGQVNRPFGKE